jgi:hypothetical protein
MRYSDKVLTATFRSVDKFPAPLEAIKMFIYERVIEQNTNIDTEWHSVWQDVSLSFSKIGLVQEYEF